MFLYENQDSLYDKINIFIELKHQNVARPLGYSHEIIMELHSLNGKYIGAEQRQFFFIEEYMPGGSIADAIKEGMFLLQYLLIIVTAGIKKESLNFAVPD